MNHKIVDSHCHLDFNVFDKDRDEVIRKANEYGVEYMLSISIDLENFKKIHEITTKNKNIWCTTGVHPNNVPNNFTSNEIESLMFTLEKNLKKDKVVGVGETGLDYFRSESNKNNQKEFFETHLQVSGKTKSPIIVHTRNAEDDTIEYINKFVPKYSSKGLIHCFTSTKELAKCALDNGFYISFSGIITFKNAKELIDVLNYVPIDRLLIETDSPYLSPNPLRGKRNEPKNVRYTMEKIAEIKNLDIENVANITTKNFFNLFSNIQDVS